MEKVKSLVAGFDEEEEERRLALILDLACKKVSIERCVEKVWAARLDLRKSHLPDISYVPCAMTLTSDSHPISIFIVMTFLLLLFV